MKKFLDIKEIIVSASLAVTLMVILPLQTFLANGEIYPYALVRLLPELLGLSLAAFVVLVLLQKVSSVVHLYLFSPSLYTALLVCAYLESGILSAGLPELNGGFVPELANSLRIVVDACVWIVVVATFVLSRRRIVPFTHWIALSVLVLALASLLDVRPPPETAQTSSSTGMERGFENQPTVVANVKYSPTRNILVFILDSMPAYGVANAVRTNAALLAKFDGFTAYTYNFGMHECTKRGVPGLVTGHYYDPNEMPQSEYPLTMYGTNSFLAAADAAGWNVAFSPDLMPYGFINLPVERRIVRQEKRSRDALAILRQSTEVPHLSLFDMVAFRISPFGFKAPILYARIRHAVRGKHSNDDFWGEKQMYPDLAMKPVNGNGKPFLGAFHSWGAHPPLACGFAAAVNDKLGHLGELLDAYREKGLYDKSLILVTTDHGRGDKTEVDGYPNHASALLWVKPEGAHGPWRETDDRTSHAKIAPMIRQSLKAPLAADEIREILKSEHPLYRAPVREGTREVFRDWIR